MLQELENIIGTSTKAPNSTSESGLYLDEMDDLNLKILEAYNDTQEGNLFELMDQAKANALKELEVSLLAGMANNVQPARKPFAGLLGTSSARGTYEYANGTTIAVKIAPKALKSVKMKIRRIGLLLNADATVQVNISGVNRSFEVVTVARTPSFVSVPVDQPLEIDFSGGLESTISYTTQDFQPMKNLLSCGCGGTDRVLSSYFTDNSLIGQDAKGLILDVEISCSSRDIIVLNYQQNETVSLVLAYAARYKAAELLVERMVASDNINRYTMLETQFLWGKRNHFRKEYQDRINWLIGSNGFDYSLNACFVCKSGSGLQRVGIR